MLQDGGTNLLFADADFIENFVAGSIGISLGQLFEIDDAARRHHKNQANITRLRKKLADLGKENYITTVKGEGYIIK